ncbi:MAG: lysylphosphatidylglycerol synthase transmembrane domain-containing protein [Anaerolineales bacterium]|nr:lysylphosphatidylglycerol synthase transmembrane domain-containing protein [Anaerolineales bacterium]
MLNSQPPDKNIVSWPASLGWKDLLRIILAVVLISVVLSKTSLEQIKAVSGVISWSWLSVAFLFYCALTFIKAAQYWSLLRRRVPYFDVARIVVIQNALSNLVTTTAGIASYLTLLRLEQNVKMSRSGIVFFIAKMGDLFSMCLFLVVSSVMVWGQIPTLHELVVLLAISITAVIGVFWSAVFFRHRFLAWAQRVFHWLCLDKIAMAQRGLDTLQLLADQDHKTVMRLLLVSLALSISNMTLTMAYSYSRIQAFHVPMNFWAIIFITAIMQLVSLIPLQAFGGLGVIEITSVFLYGIFVVSPLDIPAILIGMRAVYYLFNIAVLIYLPLDGFFRRILRPKHSF